MGRQFHATLLSPFVSQRLTMVMNKEHYSGLERLTALADGGAVTSVLDRPFPLADAADAVRHSGRQDAPWARSSSPSDHPRRGVTDPGGTPTHVRRSLALRPRGRGRASDRVATGSTVDPAAAPMSASQQPPYVAGCLCWAPSCTCPRRVAGWCSAPGSPTGGGGRR